MRRKPISTLSLSCALSLVAFASSGAQADDDKSPPFEVEPVAQLQEPWALAFLPDGRMLVTEKKGKLRIVSQDGKIGEVSGVPSVAYGGQGGLGDVVLHPQFARNSLVYLTFAEAGESNLRGAALARGTLELDDKGGGTLGGLEVIWRQVPKVEGQGHYSHRIAFAPDGSMFVSSGERQKFDPAQDMKSNLGKILRLNDDGTPAADNPFAGDGEVTDQIWTLGHRNVLGIAFDPAGKLWDIEMGPKGGDELNLVVRGANYGYPIVSNGNHYDGKDIPDHDTRPEFAAPKITWTPVISPSSLIFYTGKAFPDWEGDAFAGALSGKALVRIEFEGDTAKEAERYDLGQRIREVEQGPDGSLWLLEDQDEGTGGRLLRLTPR
jgi:glucose/arabinose dehydrogenase